MRRRKFLKASLALTSIPGIAGLYAWQVEPFLLEYVHQEMNIPNLPENWQGLKMMQISDIHIGERFPQKYIIDSLAKAKTYYPDLVVYTGDFITYKNDDQLEDLKNTMHHFVKGKIATIAILGNHDYGINWAQASVADEIESILESNKIQVLRNKSINIEGLNIIGLDDYWGLNFNPQIVLDSIDTTQANIVLSHNPDTADLNIWNNYNSWILAGHTHGGQCKAPFLNPPLLPVKNKQYTSGVFNLPGDRTMYINRALGHLWQVRFNVRPEITLFTLNQTG